MALIYRYAPDRPKAKWQWLSPGAIVATLLWVAATVGFGFYVSNFGSYNATYGSLGAVVVFLTWLYLTAYILLMGGELNAELEKQTSCLTVEA
jgi:membrane protein